MPVIFDRLSAKQWLNPAFGPNEATLGAVIARYPAKMKEPHDVLPLINKPEYDRADCINSVADLQFRLV